MSDERIRSLARTASASGSPDDRARVLVERLRVAPPCEVCGGSGQGDSAVAPGHAGMVACTACAGTGQPLRLRVELAAYCGDAAALSAIGGLPLLTSARATPRALLETWISGLSRWGHEVMVRAAVAAARVALPVWEQSREAGRPTEDCPTHEDERDATGPLNALPWAQVVIDCPRCTDHRPRRAIQAAEAWLACPCEEHRESWGLARTGDPPMRWLPWPEFTPSNPRTRERDEIGYAGNITEAALLAGETAVRAAICEALIRWALA